MTAYGIGAFSLAAALGLATTMPMWVAVTFIAVAILIITGILRSVGSPSRSRSEAPAQTPAAAQPATVRAVVPTRVILPIPRQRGAGRLARPVE
jgi:hypothetical protein